MTTTENIVNVLAIAGSDPSGGAGIQADLKSIAAGGGYGMAVITALTAQNTRGVRDVHVPPTAFLTAQLDAVSDDVRIDAVKIGMLADAEVIEAVADWLRRVRPPHVVLDPVMIATSGDPLLEPGAAEALQRMIPLADLITPNLPELAVLVGEPEAETWEAALDQARRVAAAHGVLVLAKAGHLPGDLAPDALVRPEGTVVEFPGTRIATENTHGTGCSLSSGIAVRAARFRGGWERAARETKAWLRESIAAADALSVGAGHGPVNHLTGLWSRGGLETSPTPERLRDEWWDGISGIRRETDELAYIQSLADGTLPREGFLNYVAQDALYLRAYARVLAHLSTLAPSPEEQMFWSRSAQGALHVEFELHRARLGGVLDVTAPPSAVTDGYINHLTVAGTRGYAEAAAAVLPCFWMYADLGTRLVRGEFNEYACSPEHPYAEWIAAYDSPEFEADTEQAIGIVTRFASRATPEVRERMWRAFETSAVWEREFFGQTAVE
ncbi:bifunctional hydroxymethylpyrimidine kinase/phosphomethylpyrimidine kinase [Leucobacter celer]|uniref:bifunctional hydroxymethylpyrimidine kinase/phosphomethylpyrimidine kinase n=1 Tax=Leucobacter celer TaxID=668625 RepID=UPI000AC7B9F1|nr:bifunctional hydroxymethylpyrimidine kinase/phosphomethylpyrimidine kinase [Leucobacter celer]